MVAYGGFSSLLKVRVSADAVIARETKDESYLTEKDQTVSFCTPLNFTMRMCRTAQTSRAMRATINPCIFLS
jgi:hypothetical protein